MVEETFEKAIQDLPRKIDVAEEKTYSKTAIQEYRDPTNFGVLQHPDAEGVLTGPRGNTMKITLQIIGST